MPSKRANNQGSVFVRKDGRIIAQYTSADGKQHPHTVKTKAEGYKYLREIQNKMDRGQYVDPSAMTVETWLNTWLREYAQRTVRASTFSAYEGIARNHLIPNLGTERLQALRAPRIQTFVNGLKDNGYQSASIRRFFNVLNAAVKQAIENKLIIDNPCAPVKIPRQEQKTIEFLTAEELSALLPRIPMTTNGRAIRFILGTGLRVAELCGLRWCDIQQEGFTVNQITYSVKRNGENVRICNPPKTKAGQRYIPINDKLRCILDEQQRTQRVDRMRAGEAWRGGDPCKGEQYVFATATGEPSDRNNIARCLRGCLRNAHLKPRGVHALRHTFATNWVRQGADLRTLSEILGHTNVAFTMQRYVHSDNASKQLGMNTMANLI